MLLTMFDLLNHTGFAQHSSTVQHSSIAHLSKQHRAPHNSAGKGIKYTLTLMYI
jgi:hypothetical protein